jgi:feruloyl-CoA hydratase/lyase
MNPRMHEEMTNVLEQLRYDENVAVVILTGAGDSFCAGMDLKEFLVGLRDNPREFDRVERLAQEWRGRTLPFFPKPTIAMVNGYCFGGAFSNVEACDLAIAAEEATFGLSEINFKMFPAGTVSKSVANLLRPRDALFFAMTGRPFDGKKAEQIGLVNMAVPLADLHTVTYALAKELASKDRTALSATKEAYRVSMATSWEGAMRYSMAKLAEVTSMQKDSWRDEGVSEFLDGKYRPGLGART